VDPLNVSQFLAAYNASLADVLELKVSTITGILDKPRQRSRYICGELTGSCLAYRCSTSNQAT
jgi:hypothetical protein